VAAGLSMLGYGDELRSRARTLWRRLKDRFA
jgi:hypothetical protein